MKFPVLLLTLAVSVAAFSQKPSVISGVVEDALGRAVANAEVTLTNSAGKVLAQAPTGADGRYRLPGVPGAARIEARRRDLAAASEVARPHPAPLVLGLAPVTASVTVTATGLGLPAAQVGNATSTISRTQLEELDPLQADAALRLQPGLAVIQSGQVGGVTSVFLRGAPANFTKVLLNGVPIQRIDLGGYDFSTLLPDGIEQMQILRGPDSVIYGSDAAAGVIAITTRRGDQVAAPEFDTSTQVGAYATVMHSDQLLGSRGGFDYGVRYGYLDTHNQIPGAKFRDNTYGANLGWRVHTPWSLQPAELRLQVQRIYSDDGEPGGILFYGIPQGEFKRQGETYSSFRFEQQVTPQWRQQVLYADARSNLMDDLPGPVGIPDGLGDYDGLPVTLHGANGYSVQGQAILSYAGTTFPELSPSDTLRRDLDWNTELSLRQGWSLLEGYRYYDERGLSPNVALSRHDDGAYEVLNGELARRLFLNGGVSVDRDTPFGVTSDPQASVAYYPRLGTGFWGATRLRASGGKGLKDPELEVQEYSLYQELLGAAGGAALIRQYDLQPIQPQRSRDFDFGIDQDLARGRAHVGLTWFDQRYYDLIEDILPSAFPALGIPAAVAAVAIFGGEYNSMDERARGLELESEIRLGPDWRLRGNYTATSAQVLRTYSFSALTPAINPDFPDIPIGAFAPLVGQRPFRVPPQTGSLAAAYVHGRYSGLASAYFVSRRDDSTFLTDAEGGNTLLLPNRNLDPAFGILDLSGAVRISPSWQIQAAVTNALNQNYEQVIGYPGPRIEARLGIRYTWRDGRG
ncbi:MAG: TonB-dependent receptor [Terriglobales bacterium]